MNGKQRDVSGQTTWRLIIEVSINYRNRGRKAPCERTLRIRSDRWHRQRRRRMSPRRLIPSCGKHRQRHFSRPIAFPLGRSIKTRTASGSEAPRRWQGVLVGLARGNETDSRLAQMNRRAGNFRALEKDSTSGAERSGAVHRGRAKCHG